jgi:hypothetical protein
VSVPGVQYSNIIGMNNLGDLISSFYDGGQARNFLASPVEVSTTASDWLPHPQSALPDGAGAGMSDTAAAGMLPLFHQG